MEQEWRTILGFSGYQISNTGQVRSSKVGDEWRPVKSARAGCDKRLTYNLYNDEGKRTSIPLQRALLLAFKGQPPQEGMFACHRNDNKEDNNLDNLYWGTPKDNVDDRIRNGHNSKGEDRPNAILTEYDVAEIKRLHLEGWGPSKLARQFLVHYGVISGIVHCNNWSHVEPAE